MPPPFICFSPSPYLHNPTNPRLLLVLTFPQSPLCLYVTVVDLAFAFETDHRRLTTAPLPSRIPRPFRSV